MRGLSFYISFGKNKGFKLFEKDGPSIRIKLWVFSICVTLTDIENVLRTLLDELKDRDVFAEKSKKIEKREQYLDNLVETHKNKVKSLQDEIFQLNEEKDIFLNNEQDLKSKIDGFNSRIDDLEAENQDLEDDLNDSNIENKQINQNLKKIQQNLVHFQDYFCYREEDL